MILGWLKLFNWKRRRDSSLDVGLLEDGTSEIELSDYRRAPSCRLGTRNPSGLLHGQSSSADLDLFIERLYSYYCEKGLLCIVVKWISELISLGFTIFLSGFFLLYVDWNGLRNGKCGMDAVEFRTKRCDLAEEALHRHPLTPLTFSKAIILGYLGIFSIYLIFCFLRLFPQLRDILRIRRYFNDILHVTDGEINTMPWTTILEKVIHSQQSQKLCILKDLSAHDVVMRLMRKENYLVAMINKGVLAFPISRWLPGAGPTVNVTEDGACFRLILTKVLEWTLSWCLLQNMFDRNSSLREDFKSSHKSLKKRLIAVGIAMCPLSPFLAIFMMVYLFLRRAVEFYHHPSIVVSRRWSNLSKWIFREFNEVDHLFKYRINSSVIHATDCLKQFPGSVISIFAKFITLGFGALTAVLIFIAFLERSLLQGYIFGHSLFWYAVVFATITAISRSVAMEELLVPDPEGSMSRLVRYTHYMPKRWRAKENTIRYTGTIFLEVIASIFVTPYLLVFVVPKRVDHILKFIVDFTVHIDGVGDVCSLSLYDFQKHGNIRYGSPHNTPRAERSSQGKMEKSFFSFQSTYPWWEPDAHAEQFRLNLRTFRDQISQGPEGIPNFRDQTHEDDRNNFLSGEKPDQIHGASNHLNYLQDQKRLPYLLDQYYKNQEALQTNHFKLQSNIHNEDHASTNDLSKTGLDDAQPRSISAKLPDFDQQTSNNQCDNISYHNSDDNVQYLDPRNYSDNQQTCNEPKLHFRDVYDRPPEFPPPDFPEYL